MKRKVIVVFLFSLLLVGFVIASDVAYIVKDTDKSDASFTDVFEDLDLSVEVIDDSNIGKTNFSKFRFIFIGDERLNNVNKIPRDVPIIVANKYYAKQLGLIQMGSVSQTGANDMLYVKLGDLIKDVYIQAVRELGKNSIPYYYIPHKYKPASMESVAKTPLGGKMVVGTVIGYLPGEVNKCFFGIAKKMHWTDDAENLFEDCVNFVLSDQSSDGEDDGQDDGEDDGQDDGEDDGVGIHDVDIVNDLINSVNGLRIKDVNTSEWLLDEVSVLQCGKKYKVDYKTVNVGDFTETINFMGTLGSFEWTATKTDLEPSKSTTTGSKTITIDQTPGSYELEVNAVLEGVDDDNLENNLRTRSIEVVC